MTEDDDRAEERIKNADEAGAPGVLEQIVWIAFGVLFFCGVTVAWIAEAAR